MSEPDKKREAEGEKKFKYPKSIFFIVGNEFCERFSYYGMKSILSIFINRKLGYSESKATVIYHTFSLFCYFTPIFGAMISDMFLGKFRTIVYISLVYVLGHLLKTLASIPTLGIPPVEFSLLGLALIAIGTGGIKPCVSAHGGDQFKLPEQERQLQTFFSVFYFAINAGSLISTILTPWIREDVECFGEDTCYSLAFGIPAILMLVATVIFVLGKPLYVNKPPQGSVLTQCFGSVFYALKKKVSSGGEKAEHWLDLAKDKYESGLVEDVKCVFRVLLMYLPLPIWWALFDQTGSRWTFQATRMNGLVGGVVIKPDQMQVINPLLILFLIPLFDKIIYPAFAKFNLLKKPLQRMTAGGILTASSFIISGFLELEMEKTYAKIPMVGEAHLNVMNSLPCHVALVITNGTSNDIVQDISIENGLAKVLHGIAPGDYNLEANVLNATECMPALRSTKETFQFPMRSETVTAVHMGTVNDTFAVTMLDRSDDPKKDKSANSRFRVLYHLGDDVSSEKAEILLRHPHDEKPVNITLFAGQETMVQTNYTVVDEFGEYEVTLKIDGESKPLGKVHLDQGGVYNIVVRKDNSEFSVSQFTLTAPNSIHILWLFPQYLVITIGEIMFSVTGLEFSYSQAPESMKSVLQAAWLLTVAFGNLIVIFVAEAIDFESQAGEFFMFAILMFVDMIVFAVMAYYYVPREVKDHDIGMEETKAAEGTYNPSYRQDKEV